MDRATLVEQFRLDEVHHAPAFFDVAKMTHINGEYIRGLSLAAFLEASMPWLDPEKAGWHPEGYRTPWPSERYDDELFASVAPLIQERVATLGEIDRVGGFRLSIGSLDRLLK